MKTDRLDLPKTAIGFLESEGFEGLYPPQAESVEAGLLGGRSVMVSAPTASGKTLIAMLAMMAHLSRGGGRAVYLSPLRALAAEKFLEFKKLEGAGLGKRARVAVSTGDFDAADGGLERANILVMTNEKLDSAIRHGADWTDEIGLVIADEVHLIGDEGRGPVLEMILTRMKLMDPAPQIVGLSATVSNAEEVAGWLGCALVRSDWRPVPLSEGVCDGGEVTMDDGSRFGVPGSVRGTAVDLGLQSVMDGGQALVFAETRNRSKALATKAAGAVKGTLGDAELRRLGAVSRAILAGNEHTETVKALASLVKSGVAFHHAGLGQNCRTAVEEEFRGGGIRLLASTPTLAAGVNLPARRVVISSISRYNAREGGNRPISVMEYKQLCGRAGRPQYDDRGESIIVGRGGDTADVMEHYVRGTPEAVESGIGEDHSLRTHVLSMVVTNPGITRDDLLGFFAQTLGGVQGRRATMRFAVDIALRRLASGGLIVGEGRRYAATEFGKRTSRLYIHPDTATGFRDALAGVPGGGPYTLGYLHLITECDEFFPKMQQRERDRDAASDLVGTAGAELFGGEAGRDLSRSLLALHSWMEEAGELALSDSFGVESGDMHRMAETAGRLAYCLREIAKGEGRADLLAELGDLRSRITHGVRQELVDLVRARGVGRVRARALHAAGIRTVAELRRAPLERLAGIGKIGPALAGRIKADLEGGRRA